jgi:hypothetical protein
MKRKSTVILPLASALGALVGTVPAVEAKAGVPSDPINSASSEKTAVQTGQVPNTLVSTGETLLGFIMTDQPDGTVIAQHVSHASHASHASHRSHFSSR